MIGSKQKKCLNLSKTEIIVFKAKTKKNYKTSQFQIKWPKNSYNKQF